MSALLGQHDHSRSIQPPRIRTMSRFLLTNVLLLVTVLPANAADLRVFPPQVALTGPRASQRLLVVLGDGSEAFAERTSQAKFTSSNPAVANVAADGVVRGAGDGEAIITVIADGKPVMVPVKVTKTKELPADPFRSEFMPMLPRVGCNPSPCHGAL